MIIISGFRFHISILMIVLLILAREDFSNIIEVVKKSSFHRIGIGILFPLISALIVFAVLYLMSAVKYKEPDNFYELGLSSIADFPIYFIWNFPQVFLLTLFLTLVLKSINSRFAMSFFLLLLLFSPEIIFKQLAGVNYLIIIEYVLTIFAASLIVLKIDKPFSREMSLFVFLWLGLLVFGTESSTLINMFFARNFSEWNGFFIIQKIYKPYAFSAYVLIVSIFFIVLPKTKF